MIEDAITECAKLSVELVIFFDVDKLLVLILYGCFRVLDVSIQVFQKHTYLLDHPIEIFLC
jgi:hypothetical protein